MHMYAHIYIYMYMRIRTHAHVCKDVSVFVSGCRELGEQTAGRFRFESSVGMPALVLGLWDSGFRASGFRARGL